MQKKGRGLKDPALFFVFACEKASSILFFCFSQRSGGENTAKTLSELVTHDSRNTAWSGLRSSSAIAPAKQNQFNSSWWPRSSACANVVSRQSSHSPARSASK